MYYADRRAVASRHRRRGRVRHRRGGTGRRHRPVWQRRSCSRSFPSPRCRHCPDPRATQVSWSRLYGENDAARVCGKVWLITGVGLVARLALLGYQPCGETRHSRRSAVQRPARLDARRRPQRQRATALLPDRAALRRGVDKPGDAASLPGPCGSAAIPVVAALGRRVAGDAGGIWAAVIGAVAPALIVSSLDARMYMLATTLVLASTLCLLRALERPSLLRWALYAALSILAVYTVYFALFAVLRAGGRRWRCSIDGDTRNRRPRRGHSALVTLVSLIPWVIAASASSTTVPARSGCRS